jgi:outer membrane protein assembly factor BamB
MVWWMSRRSARDQVGALMLLAVVVLALGGCWPAPGFGPDRTAHNPAETTISPETVGSLQELWSTRLNTALVGGVVAVGDAVYANDATTVHRLDADTGARRWEVPVGQAPPGAAYEMGMPFVVGDRLLVGWGGPHGPGVDNGHWVTQWLDPATGAVLGEGPPGGQIQAVRGTRVVSTRETILPSSPTPLSTLVVADGEGGSWRGLIGTGEVTLGRDHVYATDGSSVRAYPVVDGRSDCGPTPDLPVACPIWTTPIDGAHSAPVLGDDGATLFVTTDALLAGQAMLHALDTATGAVRWSADVDARMAHAPALAEDRLFVAAYNGRVGVLPASGCGGVTCEPLWSGFIGWTPFLQPVVAGGVVFTTSYDSLSGYIHAFDADGCGSPTCPPLWSSWVDGQITTTAVSDGRLYVGSHHQEVTAYG